ncbi:MAG: sulfite exporter TauE/SafE family protein [Saprospiraceae bacterium]|jgi:uncharacterized membrane protein YfcA|nr:sulfite exporter TauE/SafE family protein [Saprospiraceae bacterium]
MEFIGYLASVLIGVSLGLIGSGGSILTVPVLVYLFGVDVVPATAYSLFIVGFSALIGSLAYFRKGLIHMNTAVLFGIPSIAGVFLTRKWILPAIPNTFEIAGFVVEKDWMLLVLFAILMVLSSLGMIRKSSSQVPVQALTGAKRYAFIFLEGMVVGVITGMVGAGGGFLIIPALVFLSGLPMKQAVGTSLIIIAAKSLIGFLGESESTVIDWTFMLTISAFAVSGIFMGMYISKKMEGERLKPVFGWFVLLMGVYIVTKEVFFH